MEASEFRTFVERLAEVLDAQVVEERGLGLEVPLGDDRRQRVYVGLAQDAAQNPLLVVYTPVGEARDVDPMAALELNATTPYGALAVTDGKVVMRRTERLTALDSDSLAESVRLFALNADVIEESLYGRRDRY
jgi:hypothetical protein